MLGERIGDAYQAESVGLRPDVIMFSYISRDLWDAFMEGRK